MRVIAYRAHAVFVSGLDDLTWCSCGFICSWNVLLPLCDRALGWIISKTDTLAFICGAQKQTKIIKISYFHLQTLKSHAL